MSWVRSNFPSGADYATLCCIRGAVHKLRPRRTGRRWGDPRGCDRSDVPPIRDRTRPEGIPAGGAKIPPGQELGVAPLAGVPILVRNPRLKLWFPPTKKGPRRVVPPKSTWGNVERNPGRLAIPGHPPRKKVSIEELTRRESLRHDKGYQGTKSRFPASMRTKEE